MSIIHQESHNILLSRKHALEEGKPSSAKRKISTSHSTMWQSIDDSNDFFSMFEFSDHPNSIESEEVNFYGQNMWAPMRLEEVVLMA